MKFQDLLTIAGNEPIIESSLLLAGDVQPGDVQRQLSRWRDAKLLYQLRRGLYLLAEPYRKTTPHPFAAANLLQRPSYVSCESALAWYGLIPEYVPSVVSVTTARTEERRTALGNFIYRHVKIDLFWGYYSVEVAMGQSAFIAKPEKALLDLIYLQPGGDDENYLAELRLQNWEALDLAILAQMAEKSGSAKLQRAAQRLEILANDEINVYEAL
ncbi:MAG: hypothetical protein HY328_04115 [Chloroflexi bacterium]|nr:hypothetical protein [Chloroflexota bacterium]